MEENRAEVTKVVEEDPPPVVVDSGLKAGSFVAAITCVVVSLLAVTGTPSPSTRSNELPPWCRSKYACQLIAKCA